MSWLKLENKVAVVTGGSSGIGLSVVKEFLEDGVKVAVADINSPNDFEDKNMFFVQTDVSIAESVNSMVSDVVKHFGTIDILVNNAGICLPALLIDEGQKHELSEKLWDKIMNVNLKGVFLCAQACGRVMVEKKSGVIINMSSESGLEGSEGQSAYAATKNAVNSLTRSWAKELGKKGIRVVGVAPGIMEATGLRTPEYEKALAYTRGITIEKFRAGYESVSTTPLGRNGKLIEVASTVAFLASEKASYIHGVTLNVSGGKTRG